MPERFDELVNALHADAGRFEWANPADVRRRGRRLAYGQFGVGALVAAVTVSGGAATGYALTDHDAPPPLPPPSASPTVDRTSASPSPSPSPDSRPSPTEPKVKIPNRAMLQPADFGSRYRIEDSQGLEDGTLVALLAYGSCTDWTDTHDHRVGYGNQRLLRAADYHDQPSVVAQIASRYDGPGQADGFMRDLRAVVDRCRTVKTSDGQERNLRVVAERFAGQDALVVYVEQASGAGGYPHHVFVRQGDLVTELMVRGGSDAGARELGRKAAARLCEATPTC